MIELKLNKIFKDNNTGEDIYSLAVKIGDNIHHIDCNLEYLKKFSKKLSLLVSKIEEE